MKVDLDALEEAASFPSHSLSSRLPPLAFEAAREIRELRAEVARLSGALIQAAFEQTTAQIAENLYDRLGELSPADRSTILEEIDDKLSKAPWCRYCGGPQTSGARLCQCRNDA